MWWSAYTGSKVYLDSNIIIHAVENGHASAAIAVALLDAIDVFSVIAVTSELTIAEVMSKPYMRNDSELIARYERFFSPRSALKMVPVDRDILFAAAKVRADKSAKLADAIHVTTARLAGCNYFLTQDERLGRSLGAELTWLSLTEVSKS